MESNFIEVVILNNNGNKTLGIYKFKHEKTAWENYQRDLKILPAGTFIALMTVDNFQKRIQGKLGKLITSYKEPKKKPRKAPKQRKAIDLIRSGEIPGITKKGGK
jgi:hypothetical protein